MAKFNEWKETRRINQPLTTNQHGKLSDFTSLERWKLMDPVNQVKTAIATLAKPATPTGHYAPLDPEIILHGLFSR
jgi:hypothetical protein